MIAPGGIPKPAFNAFAMLHRLGAQRLDVKSTSALATRMPDGALAVAVWNYADPAKDGPPKTFTLQFGNASAFRSARVQVADPEHGNARLLWDKMGSPVSPTRDQLAKLRQAAVLQEPERRYISDGHLDVTLPVHGLALVELTH